MFRHTMVSSGIDKVNDVNLKRRDSIFDSCGTSNNYNSYYLTLQITSFHAIEKMRRKTFSCCVGWNRKYKRFVSRHFYRTLIHLNIDKFQVCSLGNPMKYSVGPRDLRFISIRPSFGKG